MKQKHNNEWTKVLLGAYGYLPSAVKAAKAEAQRLALSGYSYGGDIVELMDRIIDCNKRIENYINAHVLVGESLRRIGEDKALMLKEVCVERMELADHAVRMGFSLTVARRKLRGALLSFARACSVQGYGEEWFCARFGKDVLFDKIRERVTEKKRRLKHPTPIPRHETPAYGTPDAFRASLDALERPA